MTLQTHEWFINLASGSIILSEKTKIKSVRVKTTFLFKSWSNCKYTVNFLRTHFFRFFCNRSDAVKDGCTYSRSGQIQDRTDAGQAGYAGLLRCRTEHIKLRTDAGQVKCRTGRYITMVRNRLMHFRGQFRYTD